MTYTAEKYFTTHDLFLTCALVTLGFKIEAMDKQNRQKVEFCFQRENGLDNAVQAYWAKTLLLEPQTFSANLKMVKNRLYSYE